MWAISRIKWTICFLSQILSLVEATRYPLALGAIIVSVLLPGLVIFAACFIPIWLCCNWRRVPALRKHFAWRSQGGTPKAAPTAAYPRQPPVQYTQAKATEDQPDNPDAELEKEKVKIEMEPMVPEKEPLPEPV